jgi:hypothetical protein
MRKGWIRYSAKRLMDIFYQEYPHLDEHKADRRCVSNMLAYLLNDFMVNDVIKYDDLAELIDILDDGDLELEEAT